VRAFAEAQALQNAFDAFVLQVINDGAGGERFELAEALVQVGCLGNKMQVVFEDDLAIKA